MGVGEAVRAVGVVGAVRAVRAVERGGGLGKKILERWGQ